MLGGERPSAFTAARRAPSFTDFSRAMDAAYRPDVAIVAQRLEFIIRSAKSIKNPQPIQMSPWETANAYPTRFKNPSEEQAGFLSAEDLKIVTQAASPAVKAEVLAFITQSTGLPASLSADNYDSVDQNAVAVHSSIAGLQGVYVRISPEQFAFAAFIAHPTENQ